MYTTFSPPFLLSSSGLLGNNTNNILILNHMRQPHSLGHMHRTFPPYKRILETILQRAMYTITHILHRRIIPHNKRFREVWLHSFSLGVDTDKVEFFPGSVDNVLDAEIELARHYGGVVFTGELVEMLE